MADPRDSGSEDRRPEGRNRVAMLALVIIVVGILAVTFMQRQLHNASTLQDCVASGRTNCAPIDPAHAR